MLVNSGGVSSELKLNSKAVELLVVDTERPFDLSMEVGKTPRGVSERLYFFVTKTLGEIPILVGGAVNFFQLFTPFFWEKDPI